MPHICAGGLDQYCSGNVFSPIAHIRVVDLKFTITCCQFSVHRFHAIRVCFVIKCRQNERDQTTLASSCIKLHYVPSNTCCYDYLTQFNLHYCNIRIIPSVAWWRHQMETFSTLLAICAGNSSFTGEFLAQGPVTRSFGVFFDLRLNKRLRKQSWVWLFEMPSHPFWRHCNVHLRR